METVFEAMKNALGRGQRIELRRFGVFNVKPRKTGIGRNPRTGQQVSIPPGKAVRFKPGKELQALPAPVTSPDLRVEFFVWYRANSSDADAVLRHFLDMRAFARGIQFT